MAWAVTRPVGANALALLSATHSQTTPGAWGCYAFAHATKQKKRSTKERRQNCKNRRKQNATREQRGGGVREIEIEIERSRDREIERSRDREIERSRGEKTKIKSLPAQANPTHTQITTKEGKGLTKHNGGREGNSSFASHNHTLCFVFSPSHSKNQQLSEKLCAQSRL